MVRGVEEDGLKSDRNIGKAFVTLHDMSGAGDAQRSHLGLLTGHHSYRYGFRGVIDNSHTY